MDIFKSSDPRRIELPGRVLVAHQAEFMPWLGFISKAAMGDIFLIHDDTQFKKKYFENRNKVRFPNQDGWIWLNIPVKNNHRFPNMLEVEIADDKWIDKHLSTLKNSYAHAPYFDVIFPELEQIYHRFNSNKLVEFNIMIIKYAFKKFYINIPVKRVSELKEADKIREQQGTEMVISLLKATFAQTVVVGVTGRNYLVKSRFEQENLDVVYQDFKHPEYHQIHKGFLPYMSFIDLIFNYSTDDAINILGKSNYKFL